MTKAYAAIFSARFRTLLQYRAAALAGLACQFFWGILRIAIFGAFYAISSSRQPMSLPEVTTYVWLSQAFFRMVPMGADGEVRGLVRSGSVAYELVRPLDLYSLWFTRSLAALSSPVILRCVPLLLCAAIFFDLQAPHSFSAALACGAALLCALLLGAAIQALLTISLLWTIAGDGINRVATVGLYVLSGMVLPLPLYPDWFQPVLNFLPFRGLIDLPFRLYSGNIPAEQIPWVLAHQLGWTVALVLLGRWVLSMGTRRLVVQGG
ncbi:MAG TPA: ABC-2 family transporter protein [Planctomycetota bacterium]|nr:ABC-2 family transporter protein [Planctomycetota bacterium]